MPAGWHLALAGGALAAGWWLAERYRRRRAASAAFLKGVRSMISDDPDAAIEALSDAARLASPEAFETYLAMGALLRRTGDLPRATRLHRNMLVGRWLDGARRAEVERELAEDHRRSGMFAEARELLERQAPGDRRAAEALRDVLADQGEWRAAARVQLGLCPEGPDRLRAHLLAGAARAGLAEAGGLQGALGAAREAVEADPSCAAAQLALAEAEAAGGRPEAALGALGRALEGQPPAAVLLAWPALSRHPDPELVLALLAERLEAGADAALEVLRGRLLHRLGRRAEALAALRRALDLDQDGLVTHSLRDLLREAERPAPPGAPAEDLALRHELVVAALRRRARAPRCTRCGAEGRELAWRCPSCGAFEPW